MASTVGPRFIGHAYVELIWWTLPVRTVCQTPAATAALRHLIVGAAPCVSSRSGARIASAALGRPHKRLPSNRRRRGFETTPTFLSYLECYVLCTWCEGGRVFSAVFGAVSAPMFQLRPHFLFQNFAINMHNYQNQQYFLSGLNLPRKLLD